MGFYDLSKKSRDLLVTKIINDITLALVNQPNSIINYFSNDDTYIRKAAYLAIGRIYSKTPALHSYILNLLMSASTNPEFKVRQTAVNAAGEVGMVDFEVVAAIFDRGLFDKHHSVRNAVIGSVKKMGDKNPKPVLQWARKYLHHPDKEIRREICHGIELRGRTHPGDILPLLKELQDDDTARVKNTLIHVIGQISYKKNCLPTVINHLNTWNNKQLTDKSILEIIDVHERYKSFSALTPAEATDYISLHYKK